MTNDVRSAGNAERFILDLLVIVVVDRSKSLFVDIVFTGMQQQRSLLSYAK